MTNYNRKRLIVAAGTLLLWHIVNAQGILSLHTNMFLPGDSLTKEVVDYQQIVCDQENSTWDFSGLATKGIYYVKYDSSEDGVWGSDRQRTYKYKADGDSLLIVGYESPQHIFSYQKPLLVLPFSLQAGQNVITSYQGEGSYCGTHVEYTCGTSKIEAEPIGTLILSERDTLRDVQCIYSVNTETISLSKDASQLDSCSLKQVITEHYRWYARGYRYPLLEMVTSSTYDNLDHVATQQYGFRCPPGIQDELNDSINSKIRENLNLQGAGDGHHDNMEGGQASVGDSIFTYDADVSGNYVSVTYSLTQPATVHAMIIDVMGTVYQDIHQNHSAGSGYNMSFDLNGLRHGQYVIYINVNGSIYNIKIPVK